MNHAKQVAEALRTLADQIEARTVECLEYDLHADLGDVTPPGSEVTKRLRTGRQTITLIVVDKAQEDEFKRELARVRL